MMNEKGGKNKSSRRVLRVSAGDRRRKCKTIPHIRKNDVYEGELRDNEIREMK